MKGTTRIWQRKGDKELIKVEENQKKRAHQLLLIGKRMELEKEKAAAQTSVLNEKKLRQQRQRRPRQ